MAERGGDPQEPVPRISETENIPKKKMFLEKVADIPMVNAAKEYSAAAYHQVKSNLLSSRALSKAESALLDFATTAKPYLDKVHSHVKFIDGIACKGLEAVEAKVPFMKNTPQELIEEARNLCAVVETSLQRVRKDKTESTGTDAFSAMKSYGIDKASSYSSGTEFGESSKGDSKDRKILSAIKSYFLVKFGNRIYEQGGKTLANAHKVSEDSFDKLKYTIELLEFLQEKYSHESFQKSEDVQTSWIWEELNKEPVNAENANESLEQRLLSLARRLSATLVCAYSTATLSQSLADIPQRWMDSVRSATTSAMDLFTELDEATKAGEAAESLLQKARDTIDALEPLMEAMVDSFKLREEQITQKDQPQPQKSSN